MKIDVSKLGYRWKGELDNATSYKKGDTVRSNNEVHVFTQDSSSNHLANLTKVAVGQNELVKGQVAVNSTSAPTGYDGMELHSASSGSSFIPEFRHGREKNGTRAVALIKTNQSGAQYYPGYGLGAIMTDGTVRLWGYRNASGLGRGSSNVSDMLPAMAGLPKDAARIKKGWSFHYHMFLLDEDNRLWGTGTRSSGHGSTSESLVFKPISHEAGYAIQEEITDISGGYDFYGYYGFMALGVSGKVYAWGQQRQYHFGLKDGNVSDVTQPTVVPISEEHPMAYIYNHQATYSTSHLVTREGKLYTAGQANRNLHPYDTANFGHRLFDPWGSENAKVRWVQLHESNSHWASGSQYNHHTAVTLEDGRCYVIGNGHGQVGFGTASTDAGWVYQWQLDPRYPFHYNVEKLMTTNGGYATAMAWMKDGTLQHRGYSVSSPTNANTTEWTAFNSTTSGYLGPDIANIVDMRGNGGEHGAFWMIRTSDNKMIGIGKTNQGCAGQGSYETNTNGANPSLANNNHMDWVKCPANLVDFSLHGYTNSSNGYSTVHALDDKGRTWVWGSGNYGATQDDDNEAIAIPKMVTY